jgi:hypothetical protein
VPHPNEAPAAPRLGLTAVLTPTIIGLTAFFALLSLSGNGISNFSVVALTGAFGTPLSAANLALTGYLSAQGLGVLLGGFIADLTAVMPRSLPLATPSTPALFWR